MTFAFDTVSKTQIIGLVGSLTVFSKDCVLTHPFLLYPILSVSLPYFDFFFLFFSDVCQDEKVIRVRSGR